MILPRRDYPLYLAKLKPIIKGIAIGECRDKFYFETYGEEPFNEPGFPYGGAHSHSYYNHPNLGWICFSAKRYFNKNTVLHEVAHLIANRFDTTAGHGRAWKKAMKEIGGWDEGRDFDEEIAEAAREAKRR